VLFLRNDAQITVSELTSTVNDSFLLKYDFNKYNQDIQEKKKKKKKKKIILINFLIKIKN